MVGSNDAAGLLSRSLRTFGHKLKHCLWVSHERIWGFLRSRYINFLIIIIIISWYCASPTSALRTVNTQSRDSRVRKLISAFRNTVRMCPLCRRKSPLCNVTLYWKVIITNHTRSTRIYYIRKASTASFLWLNYKILTNSLCGATWWMK